MKMRILALFSLVFCFACSAKTQTSANLTPSDTLASEPLPADTLPPFLLPGETPRMLILGDSHMKGWFGEYFHGGLQKLQQYDILSIAIGGAGTKNFTIRLKNVCCGYKIRKTLATDTLKDGAKVAYIENQDKASDGYVGIPWNGQLSAVLADYKPHIVVIALGANNVNAHQDLMDILHAYQPDIPYIWVGPFKRQDVESRYASIKKSMKNNPGGFLVRSDDILGHDTLTLAHFVGKTAKRWADKVIERMHEFLDPMFIENKEEEPLAPEPER